MTRTTTMQTAAQPRLTGPASEIQEYGTSGQPALGLRHVAPVVEALNQILADALTLRDLYKKHHWQASGPAFYQFTCSLTSIMSNWPTWWIPAPPELQSIWRI